MSTNLLKKLTVLVIVLCICTSQIIFGSEKIGIAPIRITAEKEYMPPNPNTYEEFY